MVIIPLLEKHWGSQDRGSVVSQTKAHWTNQPESEPEPQEAPGAHAHFLLYPLFIYISSTTVTSWDDVMIVCFFILGRKSLQACAVESCWLTYTSTDIPNLFPHPSMHEHLCKFCIPISTPVTLSPRYFGVPSSQSLQFIKNQCNKVSTQNKHDKNEHIWWDRNDKSSKNKHKWWLDSYIIKHHWH